MLADYAAFPAHLASLLARRGVGEDGPEGAWLFGRYEWFPYPKAKLGFRKMAVLSVTDQLAYRSLAGRIGAVTDPALSATVYANRIERHGPGWRLRPYSRAWKGYQDFRITTLKQNAWAYTCITDVAAFYPSLDREVLSRTLLALGCAGIDVETLGGALRAWQTQRDGVDGLLIGGHASGVISNPVLLPLDRLLAGAGAQARYGDDITVFASVHRREIPGMIDETLATLGLRRNRGKTDEYFNPADALFAIEHQAIGSFEAWDAQDDKVATEKLWAMWEERVLGGDPPDETCMRYVLGKLASRGDAGAARALLQRLDLLTLDPKSTTRYLGSVARSDQQVAEQLASHLSIPSTPTTEAFHLQALRYLAEGDRSEFVGRQAERILDQRADFRWPTRAWAAQAWRHSPVWRYDDAIERAEAEPQAQLRRSLIGTLRGSRDHRTVCQLALAEMKNRNQDLEATVAWAVAA
jgi:hypothetical protein